MTQICNKQKESSNVAVTGSSCQQSTRGCFHHRVLCSLEGRPSLSFFASIVFSPLQFPDALMHHLPGGFLKYSNPSSQLAFHPFASNKRATQTLLSIEESSQTLHCAPGVTANKGGQLYSISSHQTRPYFPPNGRPVDAKVFRSTAELFLCSSGPGLGENV